MTLRLGLAVCLLSCGCGEVASPVDAAGADAPGSDGGADAAPDAGLLVTLTIARSGDGSGRVLSNPDGLDCGAACTFDFAGGIAVTLGATADPGSAFAGWDTTADCATLDPCTVTLEEATTVGAKFVLLQ
jgi:Divergent InlB B-repeat domain